MLDPNLTSGHSSSKTPYWSCFVHSYLSECSIISPNSEGSFPLLNRFQPHIPSSACLFIFYDGLWSWRSLRSFKFSKPTGAPYLLESSSAPKLPCLRAFLHFSMSTSVPTYPGPLGALQRSHKIALAFHRGSSKLYPLASWFGHYPQVLANSSHN